MEDGLVALLRQRGELQEEFRKLVSPNIHGFCVILTERYIATPPSADTYLSLDAAFSSFRREAAQIRESLTNVNGAWSDECLLADDLFNQINRCYSYVGDIGLHATSGGLVLQSAYADQTLHFQVAHTLG